MSKIIKIKVNPKKPETKITGCLADGTMKIDVSAQTEKGKANQELIKFLAKEFKTSKDNIKIISGKTSRLKIIKII